MSVSKPLITKHPLPLTSPMGKPTVTMWGRNRPAYIVVHFTGGLYDDAKAMASILSNFANAGTNAHYLVGALESWEMIDPDIYYTRVSVGSPVGKKSLCKIPGWGQDAYKGPLSASHAGIVGHSNSISVEICSRKTGMIAMRPTDLGWYFSSSTYANAVRLVAWLCDKYGIRVDHIVMHNQVTGKLCPAMWCNRDGAESGFYRFIEDVSNIVNEVAPADATYVTPDEGEQLEGTIAIPAGSTYRVRPESTATCVGIAESDSSEPYSLSSGKYYYTDKGWVAP